MAQTPGQNYYCEKNCPVVSEPVYIVIHRCIGHDQFNDRKRIHSTNPQKNYRFDENKVNMH